MPHTVLHPCEKHNCGGTFINVIDKRAHFRWTSLDPTNQHGYVGQSIIDLYPPDVRDDAFERMSQWLLNGHSDSWIVQAYDFPRSTPDKIVNVKVTVYPFDHGEMAGVSLVTVLPANYFDLTEDDFKLLKLLVADNSLKEIAAAMDRSASAIDARIKSIKEKLGCKSIAGLAAKAVWCHLV